MDLNRVMIIGRLTRDPEMRTIPSGQAVVSFSVATNRVWTNQDGQKQERAEFHNVVAWRKLAETIGKYLHKGSRVYIEGRLETRSWDDPTGVKRYRTEIIADNMIMLDRPNAQVSTPATHAASAEVTPLATENPDEEISVEDIPF